MVNPAIWQGGERTGQVKRHFGIGAEKTSCKGGFKGRRLRTLPFCAFKLRNFESSHRGNATERLRG